MRIINPAALGEPKGWNNGLLAPAGARLLFVAGQTARSESGAIELDDFVDQFALALDHVLSVVAEAGGEPSNVGRMTIFVTDMDAYLASRKRLGDAYRARMGRHYPAMALLEVSRLVDEGAVVEIEATAIIPTDRSGS
ncbi:MAG: RidA family protein [Gemmatimonadetes bacterium]|nr:RidA family protein [Gemmatimonadota bacterium]